MESDSLSSRIEELVALCADPETNSARIVLGLQAILPDVQSLEADYNIPGLQTDNAKLKAALDAMKDQAQAEIEGIKTQARAEIDRVNADCASQIQVIQQKLDALKSKERESENEETCNLPKEQIEVLEALQPPEVKMLNLSSVQETIGENRAPAFASVIEIVRATPPADETILHLQYLVRLGLAKQGSNSVGQKVWFRTEAGNKRAIAERLAGDNPAP